MENVSRVTLSCWILLRTPLVSFIFFCVDKYNHVLSRALASSVLRSWGRERPLEQHDCSCGGDVHPTLVLPIVFHTKPRDSRNVAEFITHRSINIQVRFEILAARALQYESIPS